VSAFQPVFRLLGDADLSRQFQDLQSQAREAGIAFQRAFNAGSTRDMVAAFNRLIQTISSLEDLNQLAQQEAGLRGLSTQANQAAQDFRGLVEEANRLATVVKSVGQVVSRLGPNDIALKAEFDRIKGLLQVPFVQFRAAIQDKDLVRAQQYLATIEQIIQAGAQGGGFAPGTVGSIGQIAEARLAVKIDASEFGRLLSIVQRELDQVVRTGTPVGLSKDLRVELARTKNDIDNLKVRIEEGISLDEFERSLIRIQDRVSEISASIGAKINLTPSLREASAEVDRAAGEYRATTVRLLSSLAGVSGTDRQILQTLKADIVTATENYDLARRRLAEATTSEDVEASGKNFILASQNLRNAYNTASSEINGISERRIRNFNALTNSAYQLGQAFEDAAIGYQLNGIAGAFRGASNNVSFLLNNLAQTPAFQDAITRRFGIANDSVRDLVGLTAGVGAAILISVIPPTIAWLESLNDVKATFIDITKELERISDKTDLAIRIEAARRELEDGLRDAKNFEDAIREIGNAANDAQQQIADAGVKIQDIFKPNIILNANNAIRDFRVEFGRVLQDLNVDNPAGVQEEIDRAAKAARDKEFAKQVKAGFPGLIEPARPGEPEDLAFARRAVDQAGREGRARAEGVFNVVREIQLALGTVPAELEIIQNDINRGIFDEKRIGEARDKVKLLSTALEELKQNAPGVFSELDFEDTFIEQFNSNINAIKERLVEVGDAVQEADAVIKKSQETIRKAIEDFEKFADVRNRGVRLGIARGDLDQSVLVIDEIISKVEDIGDAFRESIAAAEAQPGGQALAGALRGLRDRVSAEEIEIAVLNERKRIEEEIAGLQEDQAKNLRSQLTTLDSYVQRLQESALSQGAERKKQEEDQKRLFELQVAQNRLNALMALRGGGQEPEDFVRQAQVLLLPRQRQREMLQQARGVAQQVFGMAAESDIGKQVSDALAPILKPLAPLLEIIGGKQEETKEVIRKKDERARVGQ